MRLFSKIENSKDITDKEYVDKFYKKPTSGIPKSDLASAVQTSLGKADAAVPNTRKVNNKVLSSDITLLASDVGALPDTTVIPTKVSDLTNDSGFTTNTGTVTSVSVKMNGATKGTVTSSGTIDLGTVITSHQDISGLMPKSGGTFTGEVKFGSTENFQGYYIKRMLGSLGIGTAYNNLDSSYKDGTYHRMWRLRFPSGSNFWGKIKITLYGGYSSFNASGVMSKSITCNFNTSNIYNNVGCYDGLGVNVEQDFRISEAIWNADASAWEVLIWQKNLSGNNSPTIMLECWTTNNTNYINAFNGIATQAVELTQSTSYSAQKASSTGGTKTVTWETLPVYENPLGEEIATVAMLEDKQDKITSGNKLSSSLVDGLGAAAAKAVDTAITANSTSTNLPTSKAVEDRINAHSGIDKVGTVTGVKMNGTTKNPSSGVVDLGTVLTAHQSLDGKQDKITSSNKLSASLVSGLATVATSGSYNDLSNKPTINGVEITGTKTSTDLELGKVTANGGFQAGSTASATTGGAIGSGASATTGGAAGQGASATHGGAVGNSASATDGGAVGGGASATLGGAVGYFAKATTGGAVGQGAKVTTGFAGGFNAKAQYEADGTTEVRGAVAIGADAVAQANNAVQLSTGTNANEGSLQFRDYPLVDVNGKIPADRLPGAGTSLGGVKTGGDVTITDGVITVNDDSHNHVISNIDGLQTELSGKLDKTTYEWNKEFRAGSNGAISLGRYNVYDTQLTFDISSTTSASMNGKLVIATQNGRICQAKVFGDASGVLVSKIVIYQSAIVNNRSWVEVFCNFDGWSKNKVHIYGVALESATVTNQMSSVTFTNGVPSPITSGDSKWSGTIDNDLSGKANLSGGNTFTGKQTLNSPASDGYSINAAGYIKGSWLQASATSNKGANTGKVCVFDDAGWIYYRTPAEILTEAGGAKTSDIPTLQWVTPTSQDEITSAIMWKVSGQSILNTYDSEETRYILYGIGSGTAGTVAAVGNNSRRGAVQLYFGAGSYWGITGIVQEGQSSIVRHVPMQSVEGVTLSKWKILKYV